MHGRIELKLPYPNCEFDRFRKRLLPGEINGYRWMQRTDEKVFEDRANSRPKWKLLLRFAREMRRNGFEYNITYTLDDNGATAVLVYYDRQAAIAKAEGATDANPR